MRFGGSPARLRLRLRRLVAALASGFYVRVGQAHFRHEATGSFTVFEPTFHDLVAYRATADRALTLFAKGDSFVAEGHVHTNQVENNGETIEREQFVAKKIGHDLARTNYEVDRTCHSAVGAEHDSPAAQNAMSQEAAPARQRIRPGDVYSHSLRGSDVRASAGPIWRGESVEHDRCSAAEEAAAASSHQGCHLSSSQESRSLPRRKNDDAALCWRRCQDHSDYWGCLLGGLTLATFLPMSKRLQKHLASLELTKPGHRAEEEELIDTASVDTMPKDDLGPPDPSGTADSSELVERP